MQSGDTTGAIIEGAAGLMGAVPMVGDAAAKGLRSVTNSFRKKDIGEAEKLVDDAEKLQEWRDDNRLLESQRQKNIPEAQQAAEDLFQGNVTSKEARKRIKEAFPEPKLYTAETMPEMPTITDVVGSMGKKAEKGILGVKGFDLEPGQRVGARLDIPAYNEYDKWVVSIHDGKIRNGSVVGYGQAIRLKNIEFGSDPEVALDIAKGKRVAKKSGEEKPMGKATIARVFGDYVPEDPYELQEFAKKVLADKNSAWTQVGMNPYRGSYFYNKETGNVVTRADEVIQVGPLVLAKNVTEPKLSELKELFSQKTARTKDGKIRIFNEGGVVPMKRMAKQMELFEPVERGFDEGGLMDEGGMVDEVSGNDVPPGSLRTEVRDDIPAQLSEGEFVFPADVVRYIGLENLMRMRQEAKQGLAQMEAMGQMGNSEEATVQDDLPFDMYDLDIEDENEYNTQQEFARGGVVYAQQGTFVNPDPQSGVYYQPPAPITTGIAQTPVVAASAPAATMGGYKPPQQAFTPVRTPQEITPTFQGVVGFGPEGVEYETVTYVNEAGQTLVLKKNKQTGQLLDMAGNPATIPEGYKLQGAEDAASPVTTETSTVTGQGDGGDRQDYGGGTSLLTGEKIAGYSPEEIKTGVAAAKDRYAITGNRGFDLLNVIPGGSFIKSLMPDAGMSIFGTDPVYTGRPDDSLMNAQQTARDQVQASLGTRITGYVGFQKGDLDPNSGGFFDKNGLAVDPKTGDQTKNESGTMNYSSFNDWKEAFAAGTASGWRGGKLGKESYSKLSDEAKKNYNKFAEIMDYKDHTPDYTSDDGQKAPPGGYAGYSGEDVEESYSVGNDGQSDNQGGSEPGAADGGRDESSTSDAGGASGLSGDYGGGFDFNKGGLAKEMKQSGLASKK
jgi:hypothetical protein